MRPHRWERIKYKSDLLLPGSRLQALQRLLQDLENIPLFEGTRASHSKRRSIPACRNSAPAGASFCSRRIFQKFATSPGVIGVLGSLDYVVLASNQGHEFYELHFGIHS